MIVSGSKDNCIKLWEPKSKRELATLHSHKNTINCVPKKQRHLNI